MIDYSRRVLWPAFARMQLSLLVGCGGGALEGFVSESDLRDAEEMDSHPPLLLLNILVPYN